ncbi:MULTISPECIES: IclR family transcriptional regulator [unclassified Chelatococcus]|uniref:IclR family transcriptional regulator n=1 Tax=unclassified Chelatococcus TaxID=2638111 RepID=UPI001BCF5CE5|nr:MULTISPECIES: IclR family transcriptional regulator [unclassified Chelatococcus]CAH1650797.1 D-galactonate regulator, IclR family [Hyphomicrobiales bacterium]MBS7743258.1 IclR family transcriptional regulator [Chelatococcus sp. HY11]MBX3541624.1 IclR family transcriptional regulator [Chelatococcus sp.]MCO5074484.1 IclR family transcriptional regulator [Chelatococcus sp.]CAH1692864.1 D-galactonate regulator, IclR family [Hyphomicrobiales bacterium]
MRKALPTGSLESGTRRDRALGDRPEATGTQGAQTLMRGLDVLEAIASGATDLPALAKQLGTTRTTTHRLASALVDRGYLTFTPREGYSLGPKLLELGFRARRDMPLSKVAHSHLQRLAEHTLDTVQLGILDEGVVFYIDKVPGQRRFEIRSSVGDRHPVWCTGLGKALVLDMSEARWGAFFDARGPDLTPPSPGARTTWFDQMRSYAERGVAFDLEESEPQLRCVAAPIRDASGMIVAAVSVSSLAPYMQPERMQTLSRDVLETASAISAALGWNAQASIPAGATAR